MVIPAQGVLTVSAVKQVGVVPGSAAQRIVPGTAHENIVPGLAVEHVIACQPVQHVIPVSSGQGVRPVRRLQCLRHQVFHRPARPVRELHHLQRVIGAIRPVRGEKVFHQNTVGAARQGQQQTTVTGALHRHLVCRDTGPELQGVGLRLTVVIPAQGVLTVSAVKQVGVVPGSAAQRIVPGTAHENIVPGLAIEDFSAR
ncbi:hypothetical protein CIP106467_0781 [Citrobacter europaeus]|nr:hypothetical protein CIP106467_0781 [Citrobacter europaeus]